MAAEKNQPTSAKNKQTNVLQEQAVSKGQQEQRPVKDIHPALGAYTLWLFLSYLVADFEQPFFILQVGPNLHLI